MAEFDGGNGGAMGLLELFGLKSAPAQAESKSTSETIRRITEQLDRMEPARAKYIAAFAYLLGRVAHADLNVSDQETREMERIVENIAGLPEEQAILVVQIAKSQHALLAARKTSLSPKSSPASRRAPRNCRCSTACLRFLHLTARSRRSRTTKSGKSRASCGWIIPTSSPPARLTKNTSKF
jgi:hypothetical protein